MSSFLTRYNYLVINNLQKEVQSHVGSFIKDAQKFLDGPTRMSLLLAGITTPSAKPTVFDMNNSLDELIKMHDDFDRFPECTKIDEKGWATFRLVHVDSLTSATRALEICQNLSGILETYEKLPKNPQSITPLPKLPSSLLANLKLATDALNKIETHHPLGKIVTASFSADSDIVMKIGTIMIKNS